MSVEFLQPKICYQNHAQIIYVKILLMAQIVEKLNVKNGFIFEALYCTKYSKNIP